MFLDLLLNYLNLEINIKDNLKSEIVIVNCIYNDINGGELNLQDFFAKLKSIVAIVEEFPLPET